MSTARVSGTNFTPSPFEDGLGVWFGGDGTPGSATYDKIDHAVFVPADADFGGCLEIEKTNSTERLRYSGKTPIQAETYVRITARLKCITGNLPAVRIAGYAARSNGSSVPTVTQTGPSIALKRYGDIFEVSAIVGPGLRDGVDMVWGSEPDYGHFGLDLTGANGGIIRIDDLTIEDVTYLFHHDMLNTVDIRDYGALANQDIDNYDAFVSADRAAKGRSLLVPTGQFTIKRGLSLSSRVMFQGTLAMPDDAPLVLTNAYEYQNYVDAFGSEELALKKAIQALFNNSEYDSLDLGGKSVALSAPLDVHASVANRDDHLQRRVIKNGQIYSTGDINWETDTWTSRATYSASDPRKLSDVSAIASIAVGSLVECQGVGREVYVTSVNTQAKQLTLSEDLFDADGTQNFTFRRFKYLLDFSGFEKISKLTLQNIEFQCNSSASAVMMAKTGYLFHVKDCFFQRPKDRGITSIGTGCQGMLIDRCNFQSAEANEKAQDRVSIAINANSNDVKLRENWAAHFRHFAVLSGSNNIVTGNHFYQGDSVSNGIRVAGLVLTKGNTATTVVGNYIDNCFVEWTNEHEAEPTFTSGFGFSSLSVSDNVFLSGAVAAWFAYIVVKPFGARHSVSNLTVNGNNFRSINGVINRVERVDTSYADIDRSKLRNIQFLGNNFNNISTQTENPLIVTHNQNTASSVWTVSSDSRLPFSGYATTVTGMVAENAIRTSSNNTTYTMPYTETEKGSSKDQIHVRWSTSVKGKIHLTMRCD